jgi:hypothetical protein
LDLRSKKLTMGLEFTWSQYQRFLNKYVQITANGWKGKDLNKQIGCISWLTMGWHWS